MLSDKISSRYPDNSQTPLHALSLQLYSSQQKQWPMLADGVDALQNVQTRIVDCGTFSVRLQYNPKRIVSTGAKVDAASIKERKCFLCTENLPDEQQGVLFNDRFLVLCNPMPIFREHFTISHVDHIPQSIEEQILVFLALARDMAPMYSVFYNGPKCGASAPDHMHFQASPKGLIPVEEELLTHRKRVRIIGAVSVSTMERYGRSVIILESKREQEMELMFLRLTSAMRRVLKTNDEPMMNVIGSYEDETWRLTIFVRSKHRPDVFFKEGDEKVMISPAAVDIGGLLVTPMEQDFHRTGSALITSIYREVSISQEPLLRIMESL